MFAPGLSSRIRGYFTRLGVNAGAVSRSTPAVEITQTWNNPNETFVAQVTNINNIQSASASVMRRWSINGAGVVDVTKTGITIAYAGNGNGINFGGQATIGNVNGGANTLDLVSTTINTACTSLKFSNSVTITGSTGAQTNMTLTPGVAFNPFVGGALNLNGGTGKGSGNTGGAVTISGGTGDGTGNYTGANVVLSGGAGAGTGTKGIVTASRLRADGFATAFAAKTADYTSTPDDGTLTFDASGGARVNTLETAVGAAGRIKVIVKIDSSANTVTIDPNASETINGAATLVLSAQWDKAIIQSDGSNWIRIA